MASVGVVDIKGKHCHILPWKEGMCGDLKRERALQVFVGVLVSAGACFKVGILKPGFFHSLTLCKSVLHIYVCK